MQRRTMERRTAIALLHSIHDVMKMEKCLKEAGCWCDLIPVPRAISSDCGMAVQFRKEDEETLLRASSAARVEIVKLMDSPPRTQRAQKNHVIDQ